MRFGMVLPGGTATEQLEQALIAERAGWDGVFVWEAAYGVDAWTLLAAISQRSERLRLGTMLTPLPWRRPWKVASQAATLDQLSGGRAILAVGLGAVDTALGNTGEVTDRRTRAAMLDEGIDLISGLWQGRLRYEGQHYQVDLAARDDLATVAALVQQPRVPIWVTGVWPRMTSMRRVLRCDGLLPATMGDDRPRPSTAGEIRAMAGWLTEQRGGRTDIDIVMEGETPADDPVAASAIVAPWVDAGCTWWLETRWQPVGDAAQQRREVRERLEAGPPRPA